MGNFNNRRSGGEGRGRSGGGKKSDSGKSSYKAKRSFTKNKGFREKKEDEPARRSFGSGRDTRPYRERSSEERPRKTSDRAARPARRERDGAEENYSKDQYSARKSGSSWDKPRRREEEGSERPRRSREESATGRKKERDDNYGKDQYSGKRGGNSWDKPRRHDDDGSERPRRSREESATGRKKERDDSYGKDQYSERKGGSSWDKPRRRNDDENERPRRSREVDTDEKPRRSRDDKFGGFKQANDDSRKKGKRETVSGAKKPRLSKPRKHHDEEEPARRVKHDQFEEGKAFSQQWTDSPGKRSKRSAPEKKQTGDDGLIRLNKYLSNAGVASRREADTLILSGSVKVNGIVVNQLGTKISPSDKVSYGDETVKSERKVYLLLNKPKDYITTVDDPQERKTVMELVRGACKERIYPVGRLDRNTTGLLLFTNDGDITKKLTHPKFGVKKVYHVSLNKGLKPDDFRAIVEGLELEDGMIKADDLAFVGEGKKEIGIEIHSGRNRIVRRIFEHLGYDVLKLDRVVFAGLTKKDLPRGKHRFLTNKEVSFLQMIG